ncbi:MAG: FMN-binding protein [Acetobacter sp.]|nr:FMN-binding protein [Bacteroides sp.]MCM1341233.1 FMN-binding protein [Acetobacter sp.]MCM1433876.1 FMN-binding protein [Clostridiales bacterium]
MKEKAHFNPKSLTWLISLGVMIVICAGVIFGTIAIDNLANKKYNEPVGIGFTVSSSKPVDISSLNADEYNVTAVEEAYDNSGKTVAYIVESATVGYNQESPIKMETIISADGTLVCGIDILEQKETEYLGVRIVEDGFKNQFTGRYLPVKVSTDTDKGSSIDAIANATISSRAVIDGVNKAQDFVQANFESAKPAE